MSLDLHKNKMRFIYDSYTGSGGFDPSNSYTYLIPKLRELEEDFKNRKEFTILTNYFNPLINFFLNPIYGVEKKINTENVNVKNIIEKSKLFKTVNNNIRDLKLFDQSYYGVSFVSEEDLPIFFNILPQNIEEIVIVNNEINEIKYFDNKVYKDVNIKIANVYKNNTLVQKTLAWKDGEGKITTDNLGEEKRVKVFDNVFELTFIFKNGNSDLNDIPNSFQLALTNVDVYNLKSDIRAIYNSCAFPLLVIQTDQELKEVKLGNNNGLRIPSNVSNLPTYLSYNTATIDSMNEEIQDLKEYMYKMFSNNLLSDNVQYQTATSSAIASKGFDFEVKYLYDTYKDTIQKMIDLCLSFYNISTNITYEFEEIAYNMEEINTKAQEILI